MALAHPLQRLTESEYLAQERIAVSKSEFFDGEVFAMSGGSLAHSLIATNLAAELRRALSDRPSLEVEIALAEVFAKVPFPSGSRRRG